MPQDYLYACAVKNEKPGWLFGLIYTGISLPSYMLGFKKIYTVVIIYVPV